MKKITIVCIAILLSLCLTVSYSEANGYYHGGYDAGYWALPLIFFGIPALVYALSGGYYRESVYARPSNIYYESPPVYYQRTYYRTPKVVTERSVIPTSSALQRTVGDPNYWYYCRSPRGYYPDVKECPLGWKKVIPTYNAIDATPQK
ncbi:MAG: hypothetical protein WA151_05695 [Desulfatirhabdiaceae bacterium]